MDRWMNPVDFNSENPFDRVESIRIGFSQLIGRELESGNVAALPFCIQK